MAAVTPLVVTSTAAATAGDAAIEVGADARPALALFPADHPEGTDATVKLVSLKRAQNLRDPTVSTFVVDYRPGGSVMLHNKPSPGYAWSTLSGSIKAEAWSAIIGFYYAGDTWAEPAFANNIISKNASETEPARVLVTLVVGDVAGCEPE